MDFNSLKFKRKLLAVSIFSCLTSFTAQASIWQSSVSNQASLWVTEAEDVATLNPGQSYLHNGSTVYVGSGLTAGGRYYQVLSASGGGEIHGYGDENNRIVLESHRPLSTNLFARDLVVLGVAYAGSAIRLKNVDAYHINDRTDNPNTSIDSYNYYSALRAVGEGSLIEISDSTINTFARALLAHHAGRITVENSSIAMGDKGNISVTDLNSTSTDSSSMSIKNTHITSGDSGISVRMGGLLEVEGSRIETTNTALSMSWDTNASSKYETRVMSAVVEDTDIIVRSSLNGYGYGLAGFLGFGKSQATLNNVRIDMYKVDGAPTATSSIGILIKDTRDRHYFGGASAESSFITTRYNNSTNVYVAAGAHITLENSGLNSEGDSSTGIYVDHNQGEWGYIPVTTTIPIK